MTGRHRQNDRDGDRITETEPKRQSQRRKQPTKKLSKQALHDTPLSPSPSLMSPSELVDARRCLTPPAPESASKVGVSSGDRALPGVGVADSGGVSGGDCNSKSFNPSLSSLPLNGGPTLRNRVRLAGEREEGMSNRENRRTQGHKRRHSDCVWEMRTHCRRYSGGRMCNSSKQLRQRRHTAAAGRMTDRGRGRITTLNTTEPR